MQETIVTNAQPLLQDIATELAFVETHGAASLLQIANCIAELKLMYQADSVPNVWKEFEWFDNTITADFNTENNPNPEKIDKLHLWYERLESAIYQWNQATAKPSIPSTEESIQVKEVASSDGPVVQAQPIAEEQAIQINLLDDSELLQEFCNEGRDLLANIEQGILVLEEHPDHADTLHLVFRAFHTFKGNAGFLNLVPIKNLAHELESLLDAARKGKLSITTKIIDLILSGADTFRLFIDYIASQLGNNATVASTTLPTLQLIQNIRWVLQPELANQKEEAVTTTSPVPENGLKLAPLAEAPTPLASIASSTTKKAPLVQSTENLPNLIKLNTEKIDTLVDLVGELLIAQSMVVQHPEVLRSNDRDLARYLRQLARITTDLQLNAMSLRMVPIRGAFQKMNRLVRDLASSLNKQIVLQLVGEEIELDRNIVEQLSDPLIHMVRNSVDHGIELPHVRSAQGKPESGTIRLQAMHQGGGIVIRITDDGKGMDKQKILAKGYERGLIGSDFVPNDKDIYDLIFAPGFSTAEEITDISGRGVGMDVVRGCINRLRGRIEVESEIGKGSTFTIRLPLTLAIIDGMLVSIGKERFIIPTLSIRESFRPQPEMINTVQGSGEVLRVRGKLIPLVRLADQLGLQGACNDPSDGIVIVTESGPRVQGLLVDKLIGKKEVVIKSLGDCLIDQPGISGAAILGDGMVTLILDPDALGSGFTAKTAST